MKYKIIPMDNVTPWETLKDIPLELLSRGWFYHISEINSEWCNASKIVGCNKDTVYITSRYEILTTPIPEFAAYYVYNRDPNNPEVYHCGNIIDSTAHPYFHMK